MIPGSKPFGGFLYLGFGRRANANISLAYRLGACRATNRGAYSLHHLAGCAMITGGKSEQCRHSIASHSVGVFLLGVRLHWCISLDLGLVLFVIIGKPRGGLVSFVGGHPLHDLAERG